MLDVLLKNFAHLCDLFTRCGFRANKLRLQKISVYGFSGKIMLIGMGGSTLARFKAYNTIKQEIQICVIYKKSTLASWYINSFRFPYKLILQVSQSASDRSNLI